MAIRRENKDTKPIGYRARKKRQEEEKKAARPKQGDYISPFAGARDAYHKQAGRYQVPKDKPSKPSPKPSPSASKPPAPKPKPTATRPADKVPSSASKTPSKNVGPVASGDDYARNKDPKKYNPLMQKTFGYQKGDAPDQRAKREQIEEATKQRDMSKVKQGPAAPASPAKPASPSGSADKARQRSKNLLEEMRKNRTNR
jgi:hypothetical protein